MKMVACSSAVVENIKQSLKQGTATYDGCAFRCDRKHYVVRMNINKPLPRMRGVKETGLDCNTYYITVAAFEALKGDYNLLEVEM